MDWWHTIAAAAADEFADLADLEQFTRVTLRLLLAALLGGLLGIERERRGKSAGVRTHMLVALGAAFFVLVPELGGVQEEGLSRVVQGVVAGIGFLCAGTILKSGEDHVHGLTTAAGLWLTAAIGIAAGLGREMTATFGALLALAILALEGPLRRLAGRRPGEDSDRA